MKMKRSRVLSVGIVVLIALLTLAGCGSSDGGGSAGDLELQLDLTELSEKALDAGEYQYEMVALDTGKIDRVYINLDVNLLEDACVNVESSRSNADEFTVFKVKDEADIDTVKGAIDSYVSTLLSEVESYNPEQVPRINNALTFTHGKYIFFVISDNNSAVQKAVNDYVKESK